MPSRTSSTPLHSGLHTTMVRGRDTLLHSTARRDLAGTTLLADSPSRMLCGIAHSTQTSNCVATGRGGSVVPPLWVPRQNPSEHASGTMLTAGNCRHGCTVSISYSRVRAWREGPPRARIHIAFINSNAGEVSLLMVPQLISVLMNRTKYTRSPSRTRRFLDSTTRTS